MAKIIERGDKVYKCPHCGCKFQTEAGDIKWNDVAIDEGGFLGILPLPKECVTTKCPQCSMKIVIKWY